RKDLGNKLSDHWKSRNFFRGGSNILGDYLNFMKLYIRGTRGSIPTTGPDTEVYGGNTTCAAVMEDDCLLVLDGGSGMQKFNLLQGTSIKRVDILLSHLHLDHIQGLGFFGPFFDPANDIHIWGPKSTNTLHARLSRYLSPPL